MNDWNTDPLENTESTVITDWFTNLNQLDFEIWATMLGGLNTIKHLNLMIDEGLLLWVYHLAFLF